MRELGITERRLFDEILRETLAQNPQYLAVWSVWEPNALDGRDRDFADAPGHDGTGRFIPCWHRGGGALHLEPNLGYDVPGFGDWYLVPKQRRAETVTDPYEFPFGGQREFITSQAAPILVRGECVGVAGVDIAVESFRRPESTSLEETLRRGFIFLNEEGAIEYWSARTRDLVASFVDDRLDGELPRVLTGHVARLRRLGVGAELPRLRRGGAELRLKLARHPQGRRFLIIVEETAATGEAALSPREREVLDWLGHGKANAEIAIILGISTHTVKRHVERVLAKTGSENRLAAALVGLGR